jgi:hypothetical protein
VTTPDPEQPATPVEPPAPEPEPEKAPEIPLDEHLERVIEDAKAYIARASARMESRTKAGRRPFSASTYEQISELKGAFDAILLTDDDPDRQRFLWQQQLAELSTR